MRRFSQPFTTPKAQEVLYRNDLYKLIKQMINDYRVLCVVYGDKKEQVALDDSTWLMTDLIKKVDVLGRKWAKKFDDFAKEHSALFVKRLLKMSNMQIKRVLKDWFADQRLELLGETIPVNMQQIVKAHIAQNVSLVSSIAGQYHERVVGSVMRSVTEYGSVKQLQNELFRYGNMSMKRAKLIALDQTKKVYNSLTLCNCQRLGIQKMQWMHSHAVKEPRALHIRKWDGVSKPDHPNGLDGLIFDIDKPPLIQEARVNKYGKVVPAVYGYPKQLIGCQCLMRAVLE